MPLLDGSKPADVLAAARLLAAGDPVAFATETVYGLGARADSAEACAKVFALKGRPSDHPLIVHLASAELAWAWADSVPPQALALAEHFWPGPLTLVLRRRGGMGEAAAGGQASLGLRVPSHPVAQAFLRQAHRLGVPGIAAPSANRFGRVSPTLSAHVQSEFGLALPVLDGGACSIGIESAIVDLTAASPRLLRPGSLDATRLAAVLHGHLGAPNRESPRVPGSLEAHYAPLARVELHSASLLPARSSALAAAPQTAAAAWSRQRPADAGLWLQMPDNAVQAGQQLFATLRHFDDRGATHILVQAPPPGPGWDGVRDRLQRAAAAHPVAPSGAATTFSSSHSE